MTDIVLRKPVFSKVKEIENLRSGYNVFVKVLKTESRVVQTKNGQKITMIDAVVADQTACAKAFFKGDIQTKFIKVGAIIAIRNGVKRFIKNFISLEVDEFGRITQETVDIKTNSDYNISEQEHKLDKKKRMNNNRDRNERKNNNGRDRYGRALNRTRNYDRSTRKDRYQNDRRGERRGERRDRYEREDRTYRNDRPRRQYDNDRTRRPRRDDKEYDRTSKPRYEEREHREYRERRPRIEWSKIQDIEPGTSGLNIIAKVVQLEVVGGKYKNFRCVIGDETGTSKAFFREYTDLREGETYVFFNAQAEVIKEHIEIQLARNGRVEQARQSIKKVSKDFDLSAKFWVPN